MQRNKVSLDGDRLAKNLWVFLLFWGTRRASDAGIWKGPSYEDTPTTTIPIQNRMPRKVKEMTTRATDVLIGRVYRERGAIWSMMGDGGETLDEEVEWPPLRAVAFALAVTTAFDHRSSNVFSHCLPSIATNAANSEIRRLAYKRFKVATISVGHSRLGSRRSLSGEIDRLRLRRIARR